MVLANSGEGVSGERGATREGRVAASAATIAERPSNEDFSQPAKCIAMVAEQTDAIAKQIAKYRRTAESAIYQNNASNASFLRR